MGARVTIGYYVYGGHAADYRPPGGPLMANLSTDLVVSLGTFEATELTVSAVSTAGRELLAGIFGAGAVSATMPKSQGPAFAEYAEARGITIG